MQELHALKEAAKKSLFFRGEGGGRGPAIKEKRTLKKRLFFSYLKVPTAFTLEVKRGGEALMAQLLKKRFFCGFPK